MAGEPSLTMPSTPVLDEALPSEVPADHPYTGDHSTEGNIAENQDKREQDDRSRHQFRFLIFNAVPGWLVSMILHTLLMIVLGLATISTYDAKGRVLEISENQPAEQVESFDIDQPVPVRMEVGGVDLVPEMIDINQSELGSSEVNVVSNLDEVEVNVDLGNFAERTAPMDVLTQEIGSATRSGLESRVAATRRQMLEKYGGTVESEAAVANALKWLAAHQLQDGGWSFNHCLASSCGGKCGGRGSLATARTAATAMALLPFLGAGQTHMEGEYQKEVEAGLQYLRLHGKREHGGTAYFEGGGSMYGHGMCAITLCEAYAMTQDPRLKKLAQESLDYIVYAQDPVGGGWRYEARTPGDTSVVGWQLMALKSGHMASLRVPSITIRKAKQFLDSVESDGGASYGYKSPGLKTDATDAVGLLSRMYLGWKHDHLGLSRGVANLSETGPSETDMYYNYYATQVMRHYEGEPWEKWNAVMRDWLIDHQEKEGHPKGSWLIIGGHGSIGGRLYCTSMATMILEVYYRHMPLYREKAAMDDFPL